MGGFSYSNASCDKSENNFGIATDYWVVKLDNLGNVEWEKTLGGSDDDVLDCIEQTADSGYLVGGKSMSDISGNKTENSKGYYDYWIVKLNTSGEIEWQKTIGGNGEDDLNSIHKTNDGGYILGGVSGSTISGDKTDNGYGLLDYWIVKLDSSANIQWQKTIGGDTWDQYCTVEPTTDGGYIVGGLTKSGISGNKTEDNFGGFDFWVIKLDSVGTIEWQNSIGGNHDDLYGEIHQTSDGGYILGGASYSDISFDKTEGCLGQNDYWILKLDSVGNIVWQNTIGGSDNDDLSTIRETMDGGYIAGGVSRSDISFDKSENCNGEDDYWIVKLDSVGIIQWQNTFGGNSIERLPRVIQAPDGEYFVAGWSYSGMSADKTEDNCDGSLGTDFWILKLTETYNLITGKMFFDFNSNTVQDNGEPSVANRIVSDTTTGRFSFSELDGSYNVSVIDAGNFLVVPSSQNYYAAVPSSHAVSFSGTNQLDSLNDFAFQPAGDFNDLSIVLTPLSDVFNPGFDALYSIDYSNVGTTSLAGTVVFYPDSGLTYTSAVPAPAIVTVDSIVWNTDILSPFQTGNILLTMNLNNNTPIGSVVSSSAIILPLAGDADTTNNYSAWDINVAGSYDPNNILVSIADIDIADLITPPYLEYIINFQNTGTDTAINVRISNRIPFELDMSSFELVASSDPVEIYFDQAINKLEFHFDNIHLPDSNVNEPESHGFVRYRIKPVTTLSAGDSIVNDASIFFDFNAPVKTNKAVTHIVLATAVNEIANSISGLELFPNPASQTITIKPQQAISGEATWLVYDVYGREVYRSETNNEKQLSIDVFKLVEGVYLVSVQTKKKTFTARMVKE